MLCGEWRKADDDLSLGHSGRIRQERRQVVPIVRIGDMLARSDGRDANNGRMLALQRESLCVERKGIVAGKYGLKLEILAGLLKDWKTKILT